MLEALLHSGVGEVAAVVTRYYGGVKLGMGGLQRAYASGVKLALESLTRSERVERVARVVTIEYAAVDAVRRAAADLDVEIRAESFTEDVRVEVAVPVGSVDRFAATIAELTAGKGRVHEPDSPSG